MTSYPQPRPEEEPPTGKSDKLGDLRQRALAMLSQEDVDPGSFSEGELPKLLEELRIYQIELELQNEELRDTQRSLQESLDDYSSLYDFAPTGYISVSKSGSIQRMNLTASRLLDVERGLVVGRTLGYHIHPSDQQQLRKHLQRAWDSEAPVETSLRLKRTRENAPVVVQLISEAVEEQEQRQIRSAVVDVTEKRRAEVKLQQRERQYRSLFENSLNGLILFAVERGAGGAAASLRVLDYNEAFGQEIGLDVKEWKGKLLHELLPDLDHKRIAQEIGSIGLTGQPTRSVTEVRPWNRFFEYAAFSPSHNQVAVHFRDITEEHNRHKQIADSEQLHRELVEQKDEGILLLDEQNQVLYHNPAAAKHLLGKEAPMVGQSLVDLLAEPSSAQLLALVESARRGEPGTGRITLADPKGEERFLALNLRLGHGFDQQGVTLLIKDVTEFRRIERAHGKEDEILKLLAGSAAAMLLIDESTGKVYAANAAAEDFFGHEAGSMPGLSASRLFGEQLPEATRESSELRSGQALQRDGRSLPIEVASQILNVEGHRLLHMILFDLRGREQAQRELIASSRHEAVSTLSGGIAHQINNLMSTVMGYADLLEFELMPSGESHDLLEQVRVAAERASRVTQLLLAYARGGLYQPITLDLGDLIRSTHHALSDQLEKPIEFELDLDEELILVHADHSQISLALLNILQNSIEAVEPGGRITLRTRSRQLPHGESLEAGAYVLIEVIDDGHGMSREVRERAFEPFYSTRFTGRGLGLSAAWGIVTNHKGSIELESAPRRGTTLRILLPLGAEQSSRKHADESSLVRPEKHSARILLVEDDDQVASTIERILSYLGYTLVIARNGREAIDYLEARPDDKFDLALLDMRMPVMGGAEAFPRLKELRPEMKILLISGYEFDTTCSKLLADGAVGFLHKPFKIKDLTSSIQRAFRGETDIRLS